MLKALKINNIALIENLTIEFDNGLNILTGETGAGKSIIIDSLNFVLGARTDKTLIRSGEKTAKVEALFVTSNKNVEQFFENNGFEFDGEVLICRTMSLDGKADIRLNGNLVTASMLRELTSSLVDIYGQQEQVSLLNKSKQLQLLDDFCDDNLKQVKQQYLHTLEQIKHINKELSELGGDSGAVEREKDYLSFVINEIESQNIDPNKELELKAQHKIMQNAEKISSGVSTSTNALSSVLESLNQSLTALSNVAQYDNGLDTLLSRIQSSQIELDDIFATLSEYSNQMEFNENEFAKIDARLDTYKLLQKKYGSTTQDVLKYLENSKQKLEKLENSEQHLITLTNQKNQMLACAYKFAEQMDSIRQAQALNLQEKLKQNLQVLGMPKATIFFEFFALEKVEQNLTLSGLNNVELMFSANLGQQAKPLNKVASGGELSRVMLAIKSVLSETDNIQTMIFDEIDTGISGQIAQSVAEKIAIISKHHQVLVITHLVQIASMADKHYKVEKIEQQNKTISRVKLLDFNETIEELARFISSSPSSTAKQSAKELLDNQTKYKSTI